MSNKTKTFISYSREDSVEVHLLAKELTENGIEVFLDDWSLDPGDPLVERLFLDGIPKAKYFVAVITERSLKSRWVREELNLAFVQRVEGKLRVIPVLLGSAKPPADLKTLVWVDLSTDRDKKVRRIINTILGVSAQPTVGEVPARAKDMVPRPEGMSQLAATIGWYLLQNSDPDRLPPYIEAKAIAEGLELSPDEVNDGVELLEGEAMVECQRYFGTRPFNFGTVQVTYQLYLQFSGSLDYDPNADICTVITFLASSDSSFTRGQTLSEGTSLSPGRCNRAVDFVESRGYATVTKGPGTAPFSFRWVQPTATTRKIAEQISASDGSEGAL